MVVEVLEIIILDSSVQSRGEKEDKKDVFFVQFFFYRRIIFLEFFSRRFCVFNWLESGYMFVFRFIIGRGIGRQDWFRLIKIYVLGMGGFGGVGRKGGVIGGQVVNCVGCVGCCWNVEE